MSNPTNTPDPLRPVVVAPDSPDAPTTSADAPELPAPDPAPDSASAVPAAPAASAAPFAWEQPVASARHRARFATILWGALLLGFVVFMVAWTLFPGTLDPTLWLLAAVIGVGLVLVIAGIAAATRRSD